MTSSFLGVSLCLVGTCHAHLDVVYAKVAFLPEGKVQLVQRLDFAANPLVPDQVAAQQMLETGLGVDRGQGWEAPSVLGTPSYRVTAEEDATTPPAYLYAEAHQEPRRFLEATWTFEPTAALCFAMPPSHALDAVLWTVPSDKNMEKASLFYLLPGERSFSIPLEGSAWQTPAEAATTRGKLAWWLLAGLGLTIALLALFSHSKSSS